MAGSYDWELRPTLVTGGASFIGSALVDDLVGRGATVRVVDDLSSGKLENIQHHVGEGLVEFLHDDLRRPGAAQRAVEDMSVVFHLAADHGGRGYVDLHQAGCASNLALDGNVFLACNAAGVDKIVYASSGCVYPNFAQADPTQEVYLREELADEPPFDADNMYGYAKLMGELSLKAYAREWGLKSASCRYFTVYGERGKEDHAVMAMIARAFVDQSPFLVWGNGEQVRNWTYVDDIVRGTILAAEKIDDGTAVNLGTMERTRVIDAVHEVLRSTGKQLEIRFQPEMPTGPLNRVADNARARELLGWQPEVAFVDGLHRTIDWYFAEKNPLEVRELLEQGGLIERKTAVPR
ncbi:MAG: NAD-dependent epimerase/dehydratase family protein [Actinobacteria bacterium]|nr:MAG: NAD-dependent epimerase/dehydratase family protein [Actinomycetota bacterium]